MSTHPLVSIVIPAHNARSTIGLALSSLYAQTWPSWEAIVVDDGSTDDTWVVLQSLRDERVQIHRQTQSGAASARNSGLNLATGEYIGFLDADDLIFPEYLERSLTILMDSGPKTLVTHNAYFLQRHGLNAKAVRHRHSPPTALSAQQDALLRTNFASIMSVFPHDLLQDVQGFDVSLERAEDWDFWLRTSFAGWTFVHQRRPMALINRSHESLTSATDRVASAEAAILRKALRTQPLTRRQVKSLHQRLAAGQPSQLWADAERSLLLGRYREAAALHWTATRLADSSGPSVLRAAAFRAAPNIVGRYVRRRRGSSGPRRVP